MTSERPGGRELAPPKALGTELQHQCPLPPRLPCNDQKRAAESGLMFRAQHVWVDTGASAFRLCALNLAEESLWVTDETGSGLQQHLCPHDMELAIQRGCPSGPGSWEASNGLPSGQNCLVFIRNQPLTFASLPGAQN